MSGPVAGVALELTDQPDAETRSWIANGLAASNRTYVGEPGKLNLAVVARADGHGEILGGLLGWTSWEWLRIELLYVVPAWRGAKCGTRLVRAAEQEAVRRGCRAAWVDSYSFQAPGFYQQLGYTVFGTLEGYPAVHCRYFLRRTLVAEPPASSTAADRA